VDIEACTGNGIWFTIVQHLLAAPDAGPAVDEVRRAMSLEAAACIFEALMDEKPKGAVNDPLRAEPKESSCLGPAVAVRA
jgi:hypothetical protein